MKALGRVCLFIACLFVVGLLIAFAIFFLRVKHVHLIASSTDDKSIDVRDCGAKADGKTHNSKAFVDAWSQACNGDKNAVLIPQGTFLVGPVTLVGPCKGPVKFLVKGVIQAPSGAMVDVDRWINFKSVDKLVVTGGGSFDGQGPSAWASNTCHKSLDCKQLPTSVRFDFVTNAWIHEITSINSKKVHFKVSSCNNMKIEKVKITAPGDSPNTDGIHVSNSTGINIINSDIATGDDCVSLGPGAKQINIAGINCGPGHGISIGSLGKSTDEDDVIGISVKNINFDGTTNGVRIKTWAPSGESLVKDVTFEDIQMKNADNPIIINQRYCPSHHCDHNPKSSSRVKIEGVSFRNIRGTSSAEVAVSLDCSSSTPCENIELRDIDLDYSGGEGKSTSTCQNVIGVASGIQNPPSCI